MKGLLIGQRFAISIVAVVGFVLVAVQAFAEDHLCKGSPRLIGACRHVTGGSLWLTADAGYVITFKNKRSLTIDPAPSSDWDMPDWLADIMNRDLRAVAVGDFEVCPVPRRIGPTVCIESASNLVIRYRDGRTEKRP